MPFDKNKFQELISQIRDDKFESTKIELQGCGLQDEHFGELIAAINSNASLKQCLTMLDLRHNNFQDLAAYEIADFLALQLIALQGCVVKLKFMPKIANCSQLYTIDLSGNAIESLLLQGLPSLEVLNLKNNKFKENPQIERKDLPKLKSLNIENNNMESFTPYEAYLTIPKLFIYAGNSFEQSTIKDIKLLRSKAVVFTKTPAAQWDDFLPKKTASSQVATKNLKM